MQHLDDGTLHAYLDGALSGDAGDATELRNVQRHLDGCVECRDRLENARLLREEAATILAGSGPLNVAMPPFEELQAKATPPRRVYRMKSLAWAATIVLAASVGWFARSTILPTSQGRYESEDETSGRLALTVPTTDGLDADSGEEPAPPQPSSKPRDEVLTPDEVDQPLSEPVAAEVGGVRSQVVESEEKPLAQPAAGSTGAGAGVGQAQPEMQDVSRMRQQRAAEHAPTARAVTQTVAARLSDTDLTWKSVNEATAEAILESTVPTIEGLPVMGYATSALNGKQAVRVQQSLESGQLLELVITVGVDTDQSVTAKKGTEATEALAGVVEEPSSSVTIQRGNLNIRVSAALPLDSLRSLSETIGRGH